MEAKVWELEIERTKPEPVLVKISGPPIVNAEFADKLRDCIMRLYDSGHRVFLVRLDVEFMNSTALGAIATVGKEVEQKGGSLAAYPIHKRLQKLCRALCQIVGLIVGDVYFPDGSPRGRFRLRREIAKNGRAGDAFLPDALVPKLERFWSYKLRRFESVDAASPLLCNQSQSRISKRRVQTLFKAWQVIACFDRLYPFHALRHTAVTNVYRASRDLFLAQRFARHVSPLTTTIYTHPSDDELWEGVRELKC